MTVATRPTIPAERYRDAARWRVRATAERRASTRCSFGFGADLRYLTGYEALPLERLTMLVVGPGEDSARLVVPAARGAGRAWPAAASTCRS